MADSEFCEIARFANAAQADQVRGILEEHGVSAIVDGANANTAMSFVGSALGGVRVFVRAADAERATEIIASLGDDSDDSGNAWFCGQCKEEVDGGFHVCWSCGKPRTEVEQPIPAAAGDESIGTDREPHQAENREPADLADDPSNPYAAPQSIHQVAAPVEPPFEINPDAEAMVDRAWRASIVGLVLCPPVIHFYSMYLLIRAATLTTNFSPATRKRYYWALAVNVLVGCLCGILFRSMIR